MENRDILFRWTEIEPICILRLLIKKLWLILIAALTGAMLASMALSLLIDQSYSCSATFVVSSRSSTGYYVNTAVANEVAGIYTELLGSNVMSRAVLESLEGVSGSISASQLGDTNLIRVTASSDSPRDALLMIQSVMDNYAGLSDYVSSTSVLTVLDSPSIASIQTRSYNEFRICLMASAVCAVAMAALLFLMSVTRRTVHNRTGAKNNLDARILASVPHERSAATIDITLPDGTKLRRSNLSITSPAVSFTFVEAINRIASKFEHERSKGRKVFLFSSVSEAEGKSTLARNTAISLAAKKLRVLFIDLDLRRPIQSHMLKVTPSEKGDFASLLSTGVSPRAILESVSSDSETGLHTLLSTRSYSDKVELISSHLLADVLALAREKYDCIIIDTPPLGYFSDSEQLSDLSDCSVLVVRQDLIPAAEINDAIDALRAGRAELLGCVLNDMRHLSTHAGHYGYGYGYGGYGYGKYGGYSKYWKYGKYGKYGRSSSSAAE